MDSESPVSDSACETELSSALDAPRSRRVTEAIRMSCIIGNGYQLNLKLLEHLHREYRRVDPTLILTEFLDQSLGRYLDDGRFQLNPYFRLSSAEFRIGLAQRLRGAKVWAISAVLRPALENTVQYQDQLALVLEQAQTADLDRQGLNHGLCHLRLITLPPHPMDVEGTILPSPPISSSASSGDSVSDSGVPPSPPGRPSMPNASVVIDRWELLVAHTQTVQGYLHILQDVSGTVEGYQFSVF
ncbi:hypothetical protein IWQ60_000776 [Tieghemiomyces parasiticus]|uniref:Uncharacterized protein n=1 Tax=Tieghemiomyces parasiticus TaxID=78921 RepID=A0A9W8DX86_9FUNG|nr:hypothetical protein IWQ60_000776 [Tieghemiomyces parasiticus]